MRASRSSKGANPRSEGSNSWSINFLREPAIALRELTLDFICRRSEEAKYRTLILYGGGLRELTPI